MEAAQYEANVARIREWLDLHGSHELSVTVRTGPNSVPVSAGPFVGLEEHPVSKGVFRALFRDTRRVSLNPDEEKFVSFGSELQGVESTADRLVLDKGAQRIEIVDLTPVPRADDVSWDERAEAPQQPTVQAAGPSSPPPGYQPAVDVAPMPQPAPQPAPGAIQLQVKAPLYGNALGSGFFGPVNVRIEQGWMSVTGMRGSTGGKSLVAGVLMIVFAVIGLVIGLFIAINAEGNSDMGLAFCFMGVGLLMFLVGLALYLVGRARATKGQMSTLQFLLSEAGGKKRVSYDSNLGCLLMVLTTPVIGLIIMLAMGKRLVQLVVPNDRGAKPRKQTLVLKTLSTADGTMLEHALRF